VSIFWHFLEEVVDIMTESLLDKLVDEHGQVDLACSGGTSQQKEGKRFLSFLRGKAAAERKLSTTAVIESEPAI
jgi:DNA helicase MCM8